MEHKIGEIFEYNGEWYQCIKNDTYDYDCDYCDFGKLGDCYNIACSSGERSDDKGVYFKKLEKVGKAYEHYEKFYQCYKLPMEIEIRLLPNNCYPIGKDNLVEIEIKQKEDMEEKKIKLSQDDIDWLKKRIRWDALPDYIAHEEDYDRATEEIMNLFIPSDTEHSNSESIEKNLKPFDLEAAKAGKPVCTRDRRKVRIIAFDAKGEHSIIALVTDEEQESPYNYTKEGYYHVETVKTMADLMMLPEKKEGWAKVRKDINLYDTKEEADRKMIGNDEYVTAKVCWEE